MLKTVPTIIIGAQYAICNVHQIIERTINEENIRLSFFFSAKIYIHN